MNPVRTAVEDFLHLVWVPAGVLMDIGHLIQALDRLVFSVYSIRYEFDGTDYPLPPEQHHSQTFLQAAIWLQGLKSSEEQERYAVAVDDFSGVIDDLENIKWRFDNTSEADALREFELGFRTHWGHHLRSLQLILHNMYW